MKYKKEKFNFDKEDEIVLKKTINTLNRINKDPHSKLCGCCTQKYDTDERDNECDNNDCTVTTDKAIRNLRLFDAVDFDGFNYKKNFNLLAKIHTPDVRVTLPDGHETVGIDQHLADLEGFFVLADNTNVKYHFLTVAFGKYSAQLSLFQGTVSNSDNPFFPNAIVTNKFSIRFSTFNQWNDRGSFPIEKLIWDNYTFAQQVYDINQPKNIENPDFLPTSLSDSANPHTATYFQVPFSQDIVNKNLENVKKFYKYVNDKNFYKVGKMLHTTMCFVRPNGLFGPTRQEFLNFLTTLELPAQQPFILTNYIWTTPDPLFGARDWTVAVGFIQVFANGKSTTSPNKPPVIFPNTGFSPIPMISYIRWSDNKISEIHLLWDNATIINQLS